MVGIAFMLPTGWVLTARLRGEWQARRDHARGHYEVRWAGKRAPWAPLFDQLLREKYGVRVNYLGLSPGALERDGYSDGYNATSRRLLIARHGKDIFRECKRLARQQSRGPGRR
jgi:hypothetical protein